MNPKIFTGLFLPPRRWVGNTLFILSVLGLAACATTPVGRPIQAGDSVQVTYTCSNPAGFLVATNAQEAAADPNLPKSDIYTAPVSYDAVTLIAGTPEECDTCGRSPKIQGLPEALHQLLAQSLDGMQSGRFQTVELKGQVPEGIKPDARYVRLAKVRRRPKQIQMTDKRYEMIAKKAPVLGGPFPGSYGLKGEVVAVDDSQVQIRFSGKEGATVDTPFGNAVLHERDDHFAIDIQVEKGRLVRTGDAVGQVVAVDPQMFVIDYGHPFGEMVLTCKVHADASP